MTGVFIFIEWLARHLSYLHSVNAEYKYPVDPEKAKDRFKCP